MLCIGATFAKLLGALYRVPLTKIIGGRGIGLYQMVFPVYALLLDFSGAAAPSALSALIAEDVKNKKNSARNYLSISLKIFSAIGLFFSILLIVLSKRLALWQGEAGLYKLYIFLSPAIFFTCIICSFRGYFQGMLNMKPTAVSQILEQTIKLIAGLIFSKLFMPDIIAASSGAVMGITLSEIITAIWLGVLFKIKEKRQKASLSGGLLRGEKFIKRRAARLIKTALPITFLGLMLPLSNVADTFVLVNIMKGYTNSATSLFGLLSGVAMTLVGLPVAVCHGFSVVAVPAVSGAVSVGEQNKNAQKTLLFTLAFSLPCSVVLYIVAPFAVRLLFGGLSAAERSVAVGLIRLLSPAVVFLSILQTENAILIGMKKINISVASMLVGILVKLALQFILVSRPDFNVFGGAVAIIACYFFADLINLFAIIFSSKRFCVYAGKFAKNRRSASSE